MSSHRHPCEHTPSCFFLALIRGILGPVISIFLGIYLGVSLAGAGDSILSETVVVLWLFLVACDIRCDIVLSRRHAPVEAKSS